MSPWVSLPWRASERVCPGETTAKLPRDFPQDCDRERPAGRGGTASPAALTPPGSQSGTPDSPGVWGDRAVCPAILQEYLLALQGGFESVGGAACATSRENSRQGPRGPRQLAFSGKAGCPGARASPRIPSLIPRARRAGGLSVPVFSLGHLDGHLPASQRPRKLPASWPQALEGPASAWAHRTRTSRRPHLHSEPPRTRGSEQLPLLPESICLCVCVSVWTRSGWPALTSSPPSAPAPAGGLLPGLGLLSD